MDVLCVENHPSIAGAAGSSSEISEEKTEKSK
jgi:hypothetical protein